MSALSEPVGLHSADGREAQLLSVQLQGEIMGLMWRLTARQVWRNDSATPMQAQFCFALGAEQTLLSLTLERNGQSQAITQVQRRSRHLGQATLGMLKPGEQLVVVWRVGQWMSLQGGTLRACLPACLAPRAAEPLGLSIQVHDPVARGTVASPTHELQRVRHANGMTLVLRPQALLDKDLVLHVHGLREAVFAVASPDLREAGRCTVLVSASPRWPGDSTAQARLRLKLLIDSSSAMPADQLAPLRKALDSLIAELGPQDQLSCSRFGERVLHELPRLQDCTEAYRRRARALARQMDNALGLPAPQAALQAVVAIPDEAEEAVSQACILLVTSSPIWAIEAPLQALLASQHRLHVLAVGDEAIESLWRELALASGGACATLGPGQPAAAQALARLLERMRGLRPLQTWLEVTGAQTLRTHDDADLAADSDTLHLWTEVQANRNLSDLTGCPSLQVRLRWQSTHSIEPPGQAWPPVPVHWDAQGDVSRLQAVWQAMRLASEAERRTLLEQHQLPWVDCSLLAAAQATPAVPAPAAPTPANATPITTPTPPATGSRSISPAAAGAAAGTPPQPLIVLAEAFNRHAGAYSSFRAALSATLRELPIQSMDRLVLQLARQAGSPARVWALLLHCLHAEHESGLQPHALDLLEQELASTPVAVRKEVHAAFVRMATAAATQRAA